MKQLVQRGEAALARGEWESAFTEFSQALAKAPDDPRACEGHALAAWWLDRADDVFASREQAYRGYRAANDDRSAARIAVWLAWDHDAFRGEYAVASGWLQRARALLDGAHDTAEYAWLSVREAAFALLDNGNPEEALVHAAQAIIAGRASGSVDFEMVGRALRGFALATSGHIPEGMQELDGVNAAVLAGEMSDRVAVGLACCYLISACDRVREYDRAAQWCARLKEFCERWNFRVLFAVCRTQYAAVCMWRGLWDEAEHELQAASGELAASRPGMVSEALVRLGELRRRQGRFDDASALFARCGAHPLAAVGNAAVSLDRGEWERAAQLADRHLRNLPLHNRTERVAALEVLIRAQVASGAMTAARATLATLSDITNHASTTPLRACACQASGVLAKAEGEIDAARRHFEDAVDLFRKSGASFEHARAQLDLAEVLSQLGQSDAAMREVVEAEATLSGMAATVEMARAQAFRTSAVPEAATILPSPSKVGVLSPREREVLALIANGLGNTAIAERLNLSEHTVHRHVSNTLTKFGVSSRSAAVAHAARLGLL